MPAIGMGLLWSGYTLILWGYCQLQGYDVSITELVVPGRFKGKWPPPLIKSDADASDEALKKGREHPEGNPDPGQRHPGDMPWTYPPDKGTPASTSGGGGTAQV